ncbi:MAG: biotin biosynthesis protein BioY [Peptococcaceae bacterium BRH_c4b]|nr:MAG: biotin biosynthesis protein BioY [Peptococcaceae bacterium BRH_c4b]
MKFSTRDIILGAMFAALAVVAALILRFLGGLVVPFSLLPFVAVLAGAMLGGRLGAMSMLVYVLMGLVGLPVFEKPPYGGPAYVLQPTFGFLLGFIAGAYVTGKLLPAGGKAGLVRYIAATLAGVVVIYLVGLPYLYMILNFYLGKTFSALAVIKMGFIPFIGADIVKAIIASALARAVARRVRAARIL